MIRGSMYDLNLRKRELKDDDGLHYLLAVDRQESQEERIER